MGAEERAGGEKCMPTSEGHEGVTQRVLAQDLLLENTLPSPLDETSAWKTRGVGIRKTWVRIFTVRCAGLGGFGQTNRPQAFLNVIPQNLNNGAHFGVSLSNERTLQRLCTHSLWSSHSPMAAPLPCGPSQGRSLHVFSGRFLLTLI